MKDPLSQPAIRALFGTDWDGTITDGNTQVAILRAFGHKTKEDFVITKENIQTLRDYWNNDEEKCWEAAKKIPLIASPEKLRGVFKIIADAGHFHIFMSFNIFGDKLIPRFLKEIIQLEESFIQQYIEIICFWPFDTPFDKNLHLEQGKGIAKEALGLTYDIPNSHVVFTDDDGKHNIPQAREAGYKCILATKESMHLQKMIDYSESIKKPEQKGNRAELSSSSESTGSVTLLTRSMEKMYGSGATPYTSPIPSPSPPPESDERAALTKSH